MINGKTISMFCFTAFLDYFKNFEANPTIQSSKDIPNDHPKTEKKLGLSQPGCLNLK